MNAAWWEPGKIVVSSPDGCARCLRMRRAACRPRVAPVIDRAVRDGSVRFADDHRLLAPLVDDLIDVLRRLDGDATPHVPFFVLHLHDLRVERCRFLPDPLCPDCGDLPVDIPPDGAEWREPAPKRGPFDYRQRDLSNASERLRELYVDAEAGLIRSVRHSAHGLFPTATAPVGLRVSEQEEIGFGRQTSYLAAEVTAIAEALERLGGSQPGGRRTAVRTTLRKLDGQAVDPRSFGLHSPEQYAEPGFPFSEFSDDLELPWVWAWSLRDARPVLVPECLAYYEILYRPTGYPALAYEISNGCALGGSLTEAALHGIFEVAERDAFLMTWYARRRPVELRLDPRKDAGLRLLVQRIQWLSGYRVRLYDDTTDLGIPAVWVLAVDERNRPGHPKALCAGGAHLDLRSAAASALLELAPFTAEFPPAYRAHRDRVLAMLDDPAEVKYMEDHRLLYCAPEAFPRLEFLLDPRERLGLEEAVERHPRPGEHADLRDDLADVVGRIAEAGLDVLVVDQTTPEHRLGGFRCVKVLVPGSVPMTFGHRARRVTGLPRLPAQVNPDPHPFP
ncbi:TOMM precursor leader peptide-binding protein [Actinomadura sp. DSM 109109]|nr:TOMM precursor leader peptide-binding protein [Actinomadura lepetitiana]